MTSRILRKVGTSLRAQFGVRTKLRRFFGILINWKFYLSIYLLFWFYCSKTRFNFEESNNFFVILAYFYLPIALFFISFKLLRKISRFFSVPLGIVGLVSIPVVFIFTSPDVNASVPLANHYRYFFSLALPVGLSSLFVLALSIPAYFKLIFKKPQYFMFSFVLVVSLLYISTLEYRLYSHLNGYEKFLCSYQDTKAKISPKVVRIIGSYSEGSGFFMDQTTVITNRHVVEGEDYPKIVLPTGEFITPTKVEMSKDYDIAIITVNKNEPDYVVNINKATMVSGEEFLSFGYPLGSDIKGSPTVLPIRYVDVRVMPQDKAEYYQFSSALVSGMSGGPVFDKCGDFVGINTITTTGTSLIISGNTLYTAKFAAKEEPKKIKLEPGSSPKASVYAYYYLLKARDTQGCYDLLSPYYKTKSTYAEWMARFPNVISVEVFRVEEIKPNLVYVMFGMAEWVDGEQIRKTYEGTWETVKDGSTYLLNKSYILELESLYDSQGPEFFLNPEAKK